MCVCLYGLERETRRKNNGNLANLRVEGNGRLLSHELSSSSPFSYKIVVRSIQRAYSPYSIGVVFLRFFLSLSSAVCTTLLLFTISPPTSPRQLHRNTTTYIYIHPPTLPSFSLSLSLPPPPKKIKHKLTFFLISYFLTTYTLLVSSSSPVPSIPQPKTNA